MPKRKEQVVVWTCDNPRCVTTTVEGPAFDPPVGYWINSGRIHYAGGGGPLGQVYACSFECLGPAVEAVYDADA